MRKFLFAFSVSVLFAQFLVSAERPELASRTSGVAPLAVYFDSGAQETDFLQGRYDWDFGDPGSGEWLNGRSKNEDSGPIAGHVYEEPGVYVAALNGTDTVTITVSDPDVVFAGQNTRCFSQTGDFTGAPAGAMLITTTALSTVAANIAPGRRILLRRGETWTAGSVQFGGIVSGPGLIGSFGPGVNPTIRTSGQLFAPRWTDWRIQDLEIVGTSTSARAFRAAGTCKQVLLLRLSVRDVKTGLTFSTSQLGTTGELYDGCSIVESSVTHIVGGSGGYGSMFAGRRALFLGNYYDDSAGAEHIVRAPWVQGVVFAHCDLGRPAQTKHVLKLHGPNFDGSGGVGGGQATERVLIARNLFRGGLASWVVASAPEDSHTDQRVQWVLVEGNRVDAGQNMQNGFQISCVGFLARNNVVNGTGGNSCTGFSIGRRGDEPTPTNISILHNTVYTGDPDRFTLASVGSGVTNTIVHGNLGSAPLSTNKVLVSGSATNSNNLLHDSPGFVNAPSDFSLLAGSVAVDAAPALVGVWDDFPGVSRDAFYDIGAYEYVGGGSPPAPIVVPPPDIEVPIEIIADNHLGGSGQPRVGANWSAFSVGEWYPSLEVGGYVEDPNEVPSGVSAEGQGHTLYRKVEGGEYFWRFRNVPGRWRVYASWTQKRTRDNEALYVVNGVEVRVNQRQGGSVWGEPVVWNFLAEIDSSGDFDVRLVHEGSGRGTVVCADAIRIVRID